MRVIYDPAKAAGNLRKHKVSFADAEGVLQDPLALTLEDRGSTGEGRFVSIVLGTAGDTLAGGLYGAWRHLPADFRASPIPKGTRTV